MTPPTTSAMPASAAPADTHQPERVRAQASDAAVKFEAHFIKKLIDQMRSSARALSADEDSASRRANEDMLDIADGLVADTLAQQHAFGIADLMLRQILPPAAAGAAADLRPAGALPPSHGTPSTNPQDLER